MSEHRRRTSEYLIPASAFPTIGRSVGPGGSAALDLGLCTRGHGSGVMSGGYSVARTRNPANRSIGLPPSLTVRTVSSRSTVPSRPGQER